MNATLLQRLIYRLILVTLFVSPAATANTADTRTPVEVIEQTANAVATQVADNRERLEKNPDELYALVDKLFLPVFDTRYAGRLILGRHGRTATPKQRQEFVDAFYQFLVRSYAKNMLKFRKENIEIFPPPAGQTSNPKRTVIRTLMHLDDGSKASVDYSLRTTPEGWRIFDVRIEGISYVQTYRSQFDSEISTIGLDATISRLQKEAEKMQDEKPAGSHSP